MRSPNNNKTNLNGLWQLAAYLKPYRREAILSWIALTIVVVFDLLIPFLVKNIIDYGISNRDLPYIIKTTIILVAATFMSALLAVTNNIFSIRVAQKTGRDIRSDLFRKVQTLSFANIDQFQTGEILVRLTSDISQVQQVFLTFLRIGTRAPLLMIGSIILLFITSTQLALMMLVVLPVSIFITAFFAVRLQPLFYAVQIKLDRLNSILQENLAGVRVVKAFNRSHYENQRFDGANQELMLRNTRVMQLASILMPLLTLLMNLTTMSVVWFGGVRVIHNTLSIGEIIAFVNYLVTAMFPLTLLAQAIGLVSAAGVSAERILQIFATRSSIEETDLTQSIRKCSGKIVFEHVHFQYEGGNNEETLQDINLIAEPGEMIAILGATGSGKSTLLHLIPRLYEVTSGRITLDGMDIRHIAQESLWQCMGIVLQETVLFSGSISDNIRFGRPSAGINEVQQAARAAQIHDFIMQLPQQYETQVEQRGANFSGGQKQRLAIARAILIQPKILLLDDSTSAVDVETETKIQSTLQKILANCTSFVVAQRISTVLHADKIIILDQGKVAACGSHATLLQTNKIYQEIFNSQLGNGGSQNGTF